MSGAEIGLVLGLISSTITVVETCKNLYEAAHDTGGLPEAFRRVSENIPLVMEILLISKKLQEQDERNYRKSQDVRAKRSIERTSEVVKDVMAGCKDNAEMLQAIFDKVLPGDQSSFMQRYLSAARTAKPGRKQKVEDLMKQILTKLQLLHSWEALRGAIRFSKIEAALDELAKVPSSLPDDDGATYVNYGPGPQHVEGGIQGGYYSQGTNGTMNFGTR